MVGLGSNSQRQVQDHCLSKALCATSVNNPEHHFAGAGKPITGGKGAVQVVDDNHLFRFAGYLIAQNGDPRKPQITHATRSLDGADLS